MKIEVEDIKRLSISFGDTLVIKVPGCISQVMAELICGRFRRAVPFLKEGQIIVVDSSVEMTVVSERAE